MATQEQREQVEGHALNLLIRGAYGDWADVADVIQTIHETDDDMLVRVLAALYQAVLDRGADTHRIRLARSLLKLDMNQYSAMSVAGALLDCLLNKDMPGYVDTWDAVRYGFGGRNVVPVAASYLIIILGALELEKDDAYLLLDRLTSTSSFLSVITAFTLGSDTVAGPVAAAD